MVTALAVTILLTGVGCGKKRPNVAATPGPPQRAYVRLDELVAGHPLQADVERLRRAEAGLRRTADVSRADMGSAAALELSALPSDAGGIAGTGAEAARQARRQQARRLLAGGFEAQMAAFTAERERRLRRLEDQRRDELTALDAIRAAERERLAREVIDTETRAALRTRAGQVTEKEAGIEVADAQLDPAAGVFPPVFDRKKQNEEIARLRAGKDTVGIGMRPRLELRRAQLQAELDALRRELAEIKRRGEERADAAAKRVAEQRELEIEAELETLRDDAETRFLYRAQEGARREALTAEAALSVRASARRQNIVGAGGSASGPVRLSEVFPIGTGANGDVAGARRAAERIARQRQRLEQFIHADVVDTMRDVAQRRNVDVALLSGRAADPRDPRATGRRDMTRQFAGWLEPGTALAKRAAGGSDKALPPQQRARP
jgi:hypothetical protein